MASNTKHRFRGLSLTGLDAFTKAVDEGPF